MTQRLDPTQFTRESAERIANVVRAAELATPEARPLSFERIDALQKPKLFRVCTFTGAWAIGVTKTVTFKYQTATPNTASVTNLFFPVTSTAAGNTDCAIAKDGTAWYLIDVPFETATAVFAGATSSTAVMSDVTLTATLNTSNCTITIGKTLVTTSVTLVSSTFTSTFLRFKV
jgi:hypothetical protein